MAITQRPRRVLLIGVDGADPQVLEQLMQAGQLPNLTRLRAGGVYGPLRTTYPPVSPVAWTSMLTGCWPAKHGIVDFVTKAPGSYRPTLGLYTLQPAPDGRFQYVSRRSMPTLAELLSAQGLSSYLLHIPGTFPPPTTRGGVLAGLGAPDLLGSFGVPALYTTDPDALPESLRTRPEIRRLHSDAGDSWQGDIEGPGEAREPLTVRPTAHDVALHVGTRGAKQHLALHQWGPWSEVIFGAAGGDALHGICRFCLLQTSPTLLLYRTPLHHSPAAPSVPISSPADFSPTLAAQIGLFPTASFPMEQAAYQDGLLDDTVFLAGAYDVWEQQVHIAETLIDRNDWAFLAMHLFTADTLQHLFWPDIEGVIAAGYRWLDSVIGRLAHAAGPETMLIVASDHGVAPLDQWVHLNVWLQASGYLTLDERGRIDWQRTRAFCLGYGGIYLNVAGREPAGIVEPGAPYQQLRQEIADRLLALNDPQSGQPVVQYALPREAWNAGVHIAQMPDLIVALQRGYGLGREDARGQAPINRPVIEPNRGRWRGGHEGPYAPEQVPGIVLVAGPHIRPAQWRGARIVDIAPTILSTLGIAPPAHMDGQPLTPILP
jgi:predicted AlkP superfamily phosphohydrolase/phosphomutase